MGEGMQPGAEDPMVSRQYAFDNVPEGSREISSVEQVRDQMKEKAPEAQNNVAEVQTARYQEALNTLMERSGNDANLINALNDFTEALEHRAMFGASHEPLHPKQIEALTNFFQEVNSRLSPMSGYINSADNPNYQRSDFGTT